VAREECSARRGESLTGFGHCVFTGGGGGIQKKVCGNSASTSGNSSTFVLGLSRCWGMCGCFQLAGPRGAQAAGHSGKRKRASKRASEQESERERARDGAKRGRRKTEQQIRADNCHSGTGSLSATCSERLFGPGTEAGTGNPTYFSCADKEESRYAIILFSSSRAEALPDVRARSARGQGPLSKQHLRGEGGGAVLSGRGPRGMQTIQARDIYATKRRQKRTRARHRRAR
jgi:hypothetical protein